MKKVFATIILLWAGAALAHGGVAVHDAWIRSVSGDIPAAGYFVVANHGHHAIKLTGAESPAFGHAMLHHTMKHDGQTMMMHVDSVKIPAGGRVAFEPGGYHVMFMQAQKTLEPGDTVPVTLTFSNDKSVTVQFEVRSASGEAE